MKKKRVTLKDLANELGVSISTVSRALKDHPDIDKNLTKRIQALAQKWNYIPNPLAMGLLRQQTRVIGVIVPDLVTYFFSSIISGIEDELQQSGYYIVISSSKESMEKEIECVNNLLNLRIDGLIVCLAQNSNNREHFRKVMEHHVPLVFFDRVCLEKEVSTVVVDNVSMAKDITTHFHANGARTLAHITGPKHLNIVKERAEGFLKGLEEVGIPYDEKYLVHTDLSTESAEKAITGLLRLPQRPDAILGVNDTVIFATMKAIKTFGLKIPDDVLLAGFSDEFHATVVEPNLTSVAHPTHEIGRNAAKLILEQIEEEKPIQKKIVLNTSLHIRASSQQKSTITP
ncbi:LacI family transcriptional regulator [Echinicola strongylocentroti]|uniref:LacI family transcriptional regulator n=1 Tax=Echinicola strongylocentroti TaxID=1795355 RepID=A0A2Z4II49_9BACT|nr:LacI family DNA-binding transcriptional regulator [Echinicola strongylocentroti]AWW30236.1 LacI family transcriptional regulator [Echinicola strongylocentroti]